MQLHEIAKMVMDNHRNNFLCFRDTKNPQFLMAFNYQGHLVYFDRYQKVWRTMSVGAADFFENYEVLDSKILHELQGA